MSMRDRGGNRLLGPSPHDPMDSPHYGRPACRLASHDLILQELRTLRRNARNAFAGPAGLECSFLHCDNDETSLGGGRTSYKGCTGFTSGFSSATEMARMRILSFSGSLMVLAPAGKSMGYANR